MFSRLPKVYLPQSSDHCSSRSLLARCLCFNSLLRGYPKYICLLILSLIQIRNRISEPDSGTGFGIWLLIRKYNYQIKSKFHRQNTLFTKMIFVIVHIYQHINFLCSGFNFSSDSGLYRIIPDSQIPVGISDFRNSCCIPSMIKYKIKHKIVNCEKTDKCDVTWSIPPVTNCHTFSDPSPWSVTYFMDGPLHTLFLASLQTSTEFPPSCFPILATYLALFKLLCYLKKRCFYCTELQPLHSTTKSFLSSFLRKHHDSFESFHTSSISPCRLISHQNSSRLPTLSEDTFCLGLFKFPTILILFDFYRR